MRGGGEWVSEAPSRGKGLRKWEQVLGQDGGGGL